MNKKPILIITGILVLALCSFLFIKSWYLAKPEKKEIIAFLDQFNSDLKQGNADTLLNYFDGKQNSKQLLKLLGALSNRTSLNGKDKALFDVDLLSGESELKNLNAEITEATVQVEFKEKGANLKQTSLIIKLRKLSGGKFKIIQIDARQFMNDFIAYENKIRMRTLKSEDLFKPITLQAFKVAESLKAKYDSVVWFEHINNQTYYFVVKGKWDMRKTDSIGIKNGDIGYKMGLLNPQFKEIIPVAYDLIHNINGTINGCIEVEKGVKKGLFSIDGKNIVPADYDEILPLNDDENLAALRIGSDYFYLKKDYSITPQIADFKIGDILNKIKDYGNSYTLTGNYPDNILEYNDHETSNSIIISPSYLSGWSILPTYINLRNPLRKTLVFVDDMESGSGSYKITFDEHREESPWLESAFYSITDDYLGGRAGLYQTKAVLMVDKKRNKIIGHNVNIFFAMSEGGVVLSGRCNNNSFKAINDSLFEYKTTAFLASEIDAGSTLSESTYYYYFQLKNDKLEKLPNDRFFGFTRYVNG